MSEEKQLRARQYLRSWRSAKQVMSRIAESTASDCITEEHDVADASLSSSPSGVLAPVCDMDNSLDLDGSFEDRSALEDDWMDVDPSDEEEEALGDDLEASDQRPALLASDLASWACQFQVKHNAVDDLLKLLRGHGHTDLPSTTRTLLKTPREVRITSKSGMEYVHFPIKDKLQQTLLRYPADQVPDCVDLSFNVDGLHLFKSSGRTMWPILCAVHLKPVSVFPITLTCGGAKPQNLEFMEDMVMDVNNLLSGGLQHRNKTIKFHILCFVCDAPVKAFVKNVKLCTGYYGCDRCVQRGEWYEKVTYQDTEVEARSDDSFRQQTQGEHHHGSTPLLDLPINMIRAFPIDYMHQACLGVMKRLLFMWCRGVKGLKMSATQIEQVSSRLTNLRPHIPSSFARKPRDLKELERWKATEYRQFMLYTGKIVLNEFFGHFMTFSVAMNILVSPALVENHWRYAADLLRFFVERGRELYGNQFLVYNVHSMLHIAEDAVTFAGLDNCSAFKFENCLKKIKKMVRSGRCPLSQVVKRLEECAGQPMEYGRQSSNSSFILNHRECCEVIEERDGSQLCRVFQHPEPLFSVPCDSTLIGVLKFKISDTVLRWIPKDNLKQSAIKIPVREKIIFMAILHDIAKTCSYWPLHNPTQRSKEKA
ncbi:hypothetical protein N1851_027195 [Merluccius polli]|uniref:Transposase domain-containing protein n=1 Tax=Merluccius polli TaxID=89951 RepID=A0AA47MAR0_MERPO|nr:hypothetical protein N1851_027195 [Merluccius polli]